MLVVLLLFSMFKLDHAHGYLEDPGKRLKRGEYALPSEKIDIYAARTSASLTPSS